MIRVRSSALHGSNQSPTDERESDLDDEGVVVLAFPGGFVPVGAEVRAVMVNREAEISDWETLREEVLLVECLNLVEFRQEAFCMIEVCCSREDLHAVSGSDGMGVLVEVAAVGLEVNQTARLHESAVSVEEKRSRQALLLAADLRVGKCDPDLRDLTRSEERRDELDAGAEEADIGHSMLCSIFCALPEARALDIHTDIVDVSITQSKVNGILSLATTQLKNDRIVVVEEIGSPSALQRVVAAENLRRRRLDQAAESLILSEFSKFIVSHQSSSLLMLQISPIPFMYSAASLRTRNDTVHIPGLLGTTPVLYGSLYAFENAVGSENFSFGI